MADIQRPNGNAIGMIETRGLVPAIEAADAMVKAAQVVIVSRQLIGDGLVAVVVRGEVGAVKTAVEAGAAAAERVGDVLSHHVIARPDPSIDELIAPDAAPQRA